MLRLIIPFLFLCVCCHVNAQENLNKKHRLDQVFQGRTVTLPPLTKAVTRSEDSKELGYYHFAERRDVELTPFNSGQWTRKSREHTWTLEIESPGAKMINLGFTEYSLPQNASLTIRSILTGERIGPFTVADNKEHSQLWTPNLTGDKLSLELKIPEDQIQNFSLTLSAIHHGFKEVELRSASGSCNVDVSCGLADLIPIVDRYRDQIRSVANIQINGSFMCTGFLINNGNNDFKPYFITAAHCRITEANAQSIVFYWNYENSTCRPIDSVISGQNGDGPLNQFSTGSTVISSAVDGNLDPASVDFTLLLLDEPVDPDFNPYYAGWDIRPILPDSSFTVHHPNGDEKRITFDFDQPEFSVFGNDSVFIRILNWELGTTEGGSSGAPHFNTEGLVIGQVSGGNASCTRRDGFDEFGWLGLAFKNGTTPQTRLRDWLDPNNENLAVLQGLDGSFAIRAENPFRRICGVAETSAEFEITVDPNFNNDVTLDLISLPEGLTGAFENEIVSPGGTTTLTINNLDALETANYTIQFSGTDGQNANTNSVQLSIIPAVPDILNPIFPVSTTDAVESLAVFNWSGEADSYTIEIAEEVTFNMPIISSTGLASRNFSTNQLNENSEYFWRVRGNNFCGESGWSDPILFRTSSLTCEIQEDNDVGLVILESVDDTINARIQVDISDPIVDVSVPLIEGIHSWNSDLVFTLISPMGTEVVLATALCDGSIQFMDFSIGFSDQGLPQSDIPCSFTDSRIYQPQSTLDAFRGENPQGEWTLQIVDIFEFDGGILNKLHLQICVGSGKNLFTQFSEQTINACGINVANSSLELSSDFEGPVTISAIPSSDDISVLLSRNTASPGEAITFTVDNLDALQNESASIRFVTSDGTAESASVVTISFNSALGDIALVSPANNSIINTGELLDFDWDDVPEVTDYTLQLSTDFLFEVIDVETTSTGSTESILLDFVSQGQAKTVYWRVIANGTDCSKISDTFSFLADFTDAVFNLAETIVSVFPNPTSEKLFIQSDSPLNESSQLSLYTVSGQLVLNMTIPSGQLDLAVSLDDYAQGLYYLSFKSQKESYVTKIVKN